MIPIITYTSTKEEHKELTKCLFLLNTAVIIIKTLSFPYNIIGSYYNYNIHRTLYIFQLHWIVRSTPHIHEHHNTRGHDSSVYPYYLY